MKCRPALIIWLVLSGSLAALHAQPANLCPNPGAEEGQGDQPAGGWTVESGESTWADDQAHSGTHAFRIVNARPKLTVGWVSPMIPTPAAGGTFVLSFWAKLQDVSGANGAFAGFYHTDAQGTRIGQSGGIFLGGSGPTPASTDWQQFTTVANLTPEVKGVRVNMRLYGATGTVWFDDVVVASYQQGPLDQPAAIRRGLRLKQPGALAIVGAEGASAQAEALRRALAGVGCDAPVLAADQVDLRTEPRDLIVLGNLKTSAAVAYLYRQSYTFEDLYYPGAGGYVLRPLTNPVGTGANLLVIGASDAAGLQAGADACRPLIAAARETWAAPLTIKTAPTYRGLGTFPYATGGPRAELALVGAYLKLGDPAAARKYRDLMLAQAQTPDDKLFAADNALHLSYQTTTQAWDLMWADPVFSDDERLAIENYLLKIMRSPQGYDYAGLAAGMRSRENHATRAALGFYYGWRHFNKHYRPQLSWELDLWRAKLREFWAACFAGFRPFEDSLSQHALGGSMDNTLSIALMEPEWAQDFIQSGRARLMGERCIAISNNLGQTVLLGDTNVSDYASTVYAKLAYLLHDGRYRTMIEKRGTVGASSDEPFRGFEVGLQPVPPDDHVGLQVIPADDLYFRSAISTRADVDMARAFDKLALRSGFGEDDEYLMIDGVAGGSHSYDDANSLGEFAAHGRRWLCEIDIFNGPTMSFHNAVTVARDGLGDPLVPQAAELTASAQGPGWAYTATRLPKYNGTAWTRHVLWQPRKYTFVIDEMTAAQGGDYSFVVGWRSLGQPSLKPGLFESAQDETIPPTVYLDGRQLAASVAANSGQFTYHLAAYNAVLCRSEEPGDFLEVPVPVAKPGDYAVSVATLNYTGRGIMQVRLDGQPLGSPLDMYKDGSPQVQTTALGTVPLTAGPHVARFEITGRNPASQGAYMAIVSLGLQRAGEAPPRDAAANRFRLVFPAAVPATLDRDTEVLGKYLPLSTRHDAALNIVEQSLSRSLQPGQTACFQNAWQAREGAAPDLQLRRLDDHCALLKTGAEIALVGAGANDAGIKLGTLQAAGKMFCLSGERVLLHEAQASLNGQPLAADAKPGAELRQALARAWEAAGEGGAAAAAPPPWQQALRLQPQWQADLPAPPLSVAARTTAEGAFVAVGLADGTVRQLTAAGAPAGSFTTAGPVHALHAADLDGDKSQELLVGSDDTFIYALDAKLQPQWKHEVPFRAEVNHWLWWTLDTAKVRRITSGDLDGDGRPELLLGCGNMHLECLDATGQERWHFRTDHGISTTIMTADVFGDGHQRVLAGNGLTSDSGDCRVFDEQGKVLQRYYNGSWCTALPAIAVGDLNRSAGAPGDGQQTIFCGNNRGDLRAYDPRGKYNEPLWVRNLTRPIRSLTVIGQVVVAGSDSGTLCAFNQAGEKAWGLPVSSAIVTTALVRRATGEAAVAVACKDGKVFIVSAQGRLLSLLDAPGRTEDMIVDAAPGAGRDRLLLITSNPNRVWMVAP